MAKYLLLIHGVDEQWKAMAPALATYGYHPPDAVAADGRHLEDQAMTGPARRLPP